MDLLNAILSDGAHVTVGDEDAIVSHTQAGEHVFVVRVVTERGAMAATHIPTIEWVHIAHRENLLRQFAATVPEQLAAASADTTE